MMVKLIEAQTVPPSVLVAWLALVEAVAAYTAAERAKDRDALRGWAGDMVSNSRDRYRRALRSAGYQTRPRRMVHIRVRGLDLAQQVNVLLNA